MNSAPGYSCFLSHRIAEPLELGGVGVHTAALMPWTVDSQWIHAHVWGDP